MPKTSESLKKVLLKKCILLYQDIRFSYFYLFYFCTVAKLIIFYGLSHQISFAKKWDRVIGLSGACDAGLWKMLSSPYIFLMGL
jgi:hypothetical protein